jgi:hypothetical protein
MAPSRKKGGGRERRTDFGRQRIEHALARIEKEHGLRIEAVAAHLNVSLRALREDLARGSVPMSRAQPFADALQISSADGSIHPRYQGPAAMSTAVIPSPLGSLVDTTEKFVKLTEATAGLAREIADLQERVERLEAPRKRDQDAEKRPRGGEAQ